MDAFPQIPLEIGVLVNFFIKLTKVEKVKLMTIIPQNTLVRQARLLECKPTGTTNDILQIVETPEQPLTALQQQALTLYNLGFNVFPQPLGQKSGLPWKRLQYTRLHPTNHSYGLLTLFSQDCNLAIICGKTSENLFVIDCESSESLEQHITELRKRHLPIWATKTSRGGHIYLRSAQGEVANIEPNILQDAEIRGCNGYVLAPPSTHPDGTHYTWSIQESETVPVIDINVLDWLKDKNGHPLTLKLNQPHRKNRETKNDQHYPYKPLSRKTLDYLQNGHTIPEGSRNNRLFSAACDLAGNQKSYSETKTLLLPIAERSGLGNSEIERTLQSAFSQVREPAKPKIVCTKNERSQNWKYVLRYAENKDWQGRYASSNQAVTMALIERARLGTNENGIFRASLREIATLARLSTTTVQTTLKRLQKEEIPLLFRISSDNMSGATLWRFNERIIKEGQQLEIDSLSQSPPWLRLSESISNSMDFMERGALGRIGWRLYCFLRDVNRPLMPRDIVLQSVLTINQVNYWLKKLDKFGLVERSVEGWQVIILPMDILNQVVCSASGTLGKGVARRQRFAKDRALHAGRIIFAAFSRLYRQERLACFDLPMVQSVVPDVDCSSAAVKFWKCPNCGQMYFGDDPPDMCAICQDFTTWREVVEDDPLLVLVLELGAVIREVDEWTLPPRKSL